MNSVTEVRHGKPHPAIITVDQLDIILTSMLKEIPSNTKLPFPTKHKDILSLYKICTVTSAIREMRIIYEIKLPLPFNENYQLYKILPFPTKIGNKFLYVHQSMDYVLIDFDKKHFYDLTSKEVNKCTAKRFLTIMPSYTSVIRFPIEPRSL